MKRTRLVSAAAWILLLSVLTMALFGCAKKEDTAPATEAPTQEVTTLPELTTGLKDWNLSAVAWPDANGASVTFDGTPNLYQEGMTAMFLTEMNGDEIASIPCTWADDRFTCTAELEAADGYSYSLVLASPNGSNEVIPLSNPDLPAYDSLVYMKSSLNAYCNLFVSDWKLDNDKLNILSGYVQVQLPQITSDGISVQFVSAQLTLQLNGSTIQSQTLELPEGEGAGSYETALTSVSFDMPKMESDSTLEMILNVNLSNGSTITASGGTWFYNDGELTVAMG